MANIMVNTNIMKRQTKCRRVWGLIENYRSIKQMENKDLAKKIHCSKQTIYNRRKKPEYMTLDELLRYADALNIPDRELAEAIIGRRIIQMEESNDKNA